MIIDRIFDTDPVDNVVVRSIDGQGVAHAYLIRREGGGLRCSCKGWDNRGKCKHCEFVKPVFGMDSDELV
jgi:hypothetical protein